MPTYIVHRVVDADSIGPWFESSHMQILYIISAELRVESEYEKSNGRATFYERLRYLNCSIEDLAGVEENTNYFDGIVMSEVAEHVNNLEEFLVNSTRLLKVIYLRIKMFKFIF